MTKEIKDLSTILLEVIEEEAVARNGDGLVKDEVGNVVADYRNTELSHVLEFTLSPGAKSFTLEVGSQIVTQPLTAEVQVPGGRFFVLAIG